MLKGVNIMKKKFKMENLECANCAAKMEELIKKIDGVHDASMSFIMQKLTIEAEEDKFDTILEEAQRICNKFEHECKIIF